MKLLCVWQDYRENARDFLAALFHEEKQPEKAEAALRGDPVDQARPKAASDAPPVPAANGRAATAGNAPNGGVRSGGTGGGTQKATAGRAASDGYPKVGTESFKGTAAVSKSEKPAGWAWRRSREEKENEKEFQIPSIDEVLAQLDLEDEQEREMRH